MTFDGTRSRMTAFDPRLLMRGSGALLGIVVGNQLAVPRALGTDQAIREAF